MKRLGAAFVDGKSQSVSIGRQVKCLHVTFKLARDRRDDAGLQIKAAQAQIFRALVASDEERFSIGGKLAAAPRNLLPVLGRKLIQLTGRNVTKVEVAFIDGN